MKHEITEHQRHQLDHAQFICSLLQRDKHASTLSLTILYNKIDALPDIKTTTSKNGSHQQDNTGKLK